MINTIRIGDTEIRNYTSVYEFRDALLRHEPARIHAWRQASKHYEAYFLDSNSRVHHYAVNDKIPTGIVGTISKARASSGIKQVHGKIIVPEDDQIYLVFSGYSAIYLEDRYWVALDSKAWKGTRYGPILYTKKDEHREWLRRKSEELEQLTVQEWLEAVKALSVQGTKVSFFRDSSLPSLTFEAVNRRLHFCLFAFDEDAGLEALLKTAVKGFSTKDLTPEVQHFDFLQSIGM